MRTGVSRRVRGHRGHPRQIRQNPGHQTYASMHNTLHASNYSGNCVAGKAGGLRFSIAGCAGGRQHWQVHEAMIDLRLYTDNFCWRGRTLRREEERGHGRDRHRGWRLGWPTTFGPGGKGSAVRPFSQHTTPSADFSQIKNLCVFC